MHFDYTLKFNLPLDQAWATVMDIENLAPCMPGAKIESRDGDNYRGRLKVKLGPMEMVYRGDIHFIERDDDAKRAVVDAAAKEAKGRGAAKTQVTLVGRATESGSEIDLSSDFTVSGKAAQFGRGVMEEVGEQLMDTFAERLARQIDETPLTAPAAADVTSASDIVPEPAPIASDESPQSNSADDALDIGEAVRAPLAKRFGWIAAIVALGTLIYFLI